MDEHGTHLFETDPSGALMAYKAGSIGAGRNTVMSVFEEKYEENMTVEAAIALGIEALTKASEAEIKPETVEIGLVQVGESFRKMDPEDVKARLASKAK